MGHLYNQSIVDSTLRHAVSHFTCSISGHFDMQQQPHLAACRQVVRRRTVSRVKSIKFAFLHFTFCSYRSDVHFGISDVLFYAVAFIAAAPPLRKYRVGNFRFYCYYSSRPSEGLLIYGRVSDFPSRRTQYYLLSGWHNMQTLMEMKWAFSNKTTTEGRKKTQIHNIRDGSDKLFYRLTLYSCQTGGRKYSQLQSTKSARHNEVKSHCQTCQIEI